MIIMLFEGKCAYINVLTDKQRLICCYFHKNCVVYEDRSKEFMGGWRASKGVSCSLLLHLFLMWHATNNFCNFLSTNNFLVSIENTFGY